LNLDLFKEIFDNFVEPVYIVDPENYQILYVNKVLKEKLGECVGEKCYRVFQNLSSPCSFCSNKYLYRNPEKPYIWLHRNLKNNRWYKCIDQFIKYNGKFLRLEIAIDVTKEIIKNKLLKEKMREYAHLFENVPVPLYRTTLEGRFIKVNKAMVELFGYSRKDFKEINACDLYYHPQDREKFIKKIEKFGYVEGYPVKLKTKDGRLLTCLLYTTPIKNADNQIVGFEGMIKDITLERSFRKLLKDKIKEEKGPRNSLISQLSLTHDFHNLLQIILNNLLLMKNYCQKGELLKIETTIERLKEIILKNQNLTTALTKIAIEELRKKDLVNIKKIIVRAFELFEKKEEIIFSLNIDEEIKVSGWENQLLTLFLNLIKNAWEARKEDKAKIEIWGEIVEKEGKDYLKISFKDYGKGIKKEEQNKIFQHYSSKKHLGIGLIIVSEIIKNHQGMIEWESEENNFTVFHIYLPIAERKDKKRILLIGENSQLLTIIKNILHLNNYEFLHQKELEKGIKSYQEAKELNKPFLGIFYDTLYPQLPKDSENLKKFIDLEPKTKIIYSAFIKEEDFKNFENFNNNIIFLRKPYTTEDFLKAVNGLVKTDK